MNSIENNRQIYRTAFLKYGGEDIKSVGWSESASLRYAELVKIAPLGGSSILDIGCGIGAFYQYMVKDCGIDNISYKGIDIVEEMILHAKQKYTDINFEIRNIFEQPIEEKYDYVFLSGTFNARASDSEEYMKKLLQEAFSYCKKGLAFNFISTYVNFRDEAMSYHNPQDIFTFCVENLSRKVEMHHHYMKCDTAVFVYR